MMKNEDAVSPVIGVMLMIVVTVVIAAVVSAYAGDMTGGQSAAPTASIKTSIVKEDADNAILTFKHNGGDSINTANLRIYVSYTNSDGNPQQNRTSGALASLTNSEGTSVTAKVPYLTDTKIGTVGDDATNFGNFMWTTGQILSSGNAAGFEAIMGVSPSEISLGDTFNIKLVDTSSQKAIVDQDVTVQ